MTHFTQPRSNAVFVAAASVLLFTLFLVGYLPKVQEGQILRSQELRTLEEFKARQQENAFLNKRADDLQNSREEVVRVIRQKLGYAKPGETIFRFAE